MRISCRFFFLQVCAGQLASTSDRPAADSDFDSGHRSSEFAQSMRQSDACSDIAIIQLKVDTHHECRNSPTMSIIHTNLNPGDSSIPIGSKLPPVCVHVLKSLFPTHSGLEVVGLCAGYTDVYTEILWVLFFSDPRGNRLNLKCSLR